MTYTKIYEYPDWRAFVDAAANADLSRKKPSDRCSTITDAERTEWTGSVSLDAMVATARSGGWTEAPDRQMAETIAEAVGSKMQYPSYQVTDVPDFAEGFDVGALINGDPNHWIAPVYTQSPVAGRGRVITVLCNLSVSAGVEREPQVRRGALAVAITEALERAGYPVELMGVIAAADNRGYAATVHAEYRVPIKPAGQPLDRERALIALAHPGTFRRLGFAIFEGEKDRRIYKAVGATRHMGSVAQSTMSADVTLPELMLDEHVFDTDASAIRYALAELRRIGALADDAAA